jgi:hypothetical protein
VRLLFSRLSQYSRFKGSNLLHKELGEAGAKRELAASGGMQRQTTKQLANILSQSTAGNLLK